MTLTTFFSSMGMDEHPTKHLFGVYHLIYFLGFIIAFIVLFTIMNKLKKKNQDRVINIALVLIMFLKYITEVIFIYEYYNLNPQLSTYAHPFLHINTFFSFQLCGVMNIVLPLVIWLNIKPLKPFVYMTSILGGLAVVLYPVTVLFGEPPLITLPVVRSVLVHFFLVFIPIFQIKRGDLKLESKQALPIAIGLLTVAAWAMFGNLFIDSTANNMYLMVNPFLNGPIPIISKIPSGWHVLLLAVLVTIGYFIVYHIAKLFEKKQNAGFQTEIIEV
ncbi:MAG: hypothetical protein WC152_06605 [Candidatus Izemoplasmatales bacterium]